MKKFTMVLQFELTNYFKNKSYMVTTLLLGILLSAILFLPRWIDMSSFLGTEAGKESKTEEGEKGAETGRSERTMALYDEQGFISDPAVLSSYFPDTSFTRVSSADEVQELVAGDNAEAGFVVKSATEFDYYVFNQGMSSTTSSLFKEVMSDMNRMKYCEANGLDYAELKAAYDSPITMKEQILGKDTRSNYWYCYMLVILVFFLIVFYGVMIATSVTTEKSNRSIEILVTSTSPTSLLFGKVIAAAVASIFQVFFILGLILFSYQMNREAWGGMLDMVLDIPAEVLLTFGFFGLGGFLFYAFLYGAMGALVSKTEDVNKSSGGIQMIVMLVYFLVLLQMGNPDGIVIKVCSFLPFSSYSAMFARVAMGTVSVWEIVLSFAILVVSIFAAGFLGAKIYRMGTLRYGNPIKLSNAIKSLKKSE